MKNVSVVRVKVTFPFKGHFYDSIDEYVYKQFLNYLNKMTCVVTNTLCKECVRSQQCRYYKITGENFKQYPGIFMKSNLFSKTIVKNEEEYEFIFILIGSMKKYYSYIEVFFKNYLEQKIASIPFYLKSITIEELEDVDKKVTKLTNAFCFSNKSFIDDYNDLVNYYNQQYDCTFNTIDELNAITVLEKNIQYPNFVSKTCIRKRKGKYRVVSFLDEVLINSSLLYIGVGRSNDIGGGYHED